MKPVSAIASAWRYTPGHTRHVGALAACAALLLFGALAGHAGLARAADSSAAGAAALKVLLDSEDRAKSTPAAADAEPANGTAGASAAGTSSAATASRPAPRSAPVRPASAMALSTGARSTVQVSRTETLESVIRRSMPELPLKDTVVRQAFMQLNPQAFPVRNVTVIRAGTVLQVPNADDLRAVAMRESPSAVSLFLGNSFTQAPREVTPEEKRQWVRYP